MEKLKPCPFCGSEAKPVFRGRGGVNYVVCSNEEGCWCGMTCPVTTPEEAARIWNRRAIDRDALLKIADDLDISCAEFFEEVVACEDVDKFEQSIAARIRKAVGE